jgi:hypothetical protein
LGGCGVEGLVVLCLHPQMLIDLLEFADTPISFGELSLDFVECDPMFLIPFSELYV